MAGPEGPMNSLLLRSLFAGAALALAGCSHLDLAGSSDPNRVLTGSVDFRDPHQLPDSAQLPVGATLVVRVIDPNPPQAAAPVLTSAQASAPKLAAVPEVLGEQTITDPGDPPFRYRIEYRADDDRLRSGLTLEARVSYGGRLQFSNSTSYSVGLNDANDPHPILLDRVGGP